ncbi:MAG: hypothetical protein OEO79_11270 [Gemmatimonadota bacterium]|nr:hypothetical protein [Gemmatimonadota bacterium]MDH3423026.1 hypothetical protein [Gemmatimonadota bacterium]
MTRASILGSVAALLLLGAVAPSVASAQAICSAPHSSPTLVQSGELRTLRAGTGWIQLSVYGQRATEWFDNSGDRRAFLANSEFETRSVFLTAAVGVADGLEVWAQLPRHHLNVDGAGGSSTSTGVGDVRVAMRVGAEFFGLDLPVAVRFGAKLPGSDFPIDATVLPLTEGQTDLEVSVESGVTLGDLPLYVMGWVGYRRRSENIEAARRPGAERFAHAAFGGFVGDLTWEVAADGLWGGSPLASGIVLTSERRQMIQVLPTVGYGIGPGRLEVTGQLPISGRVLPAAMGVSAGYRVGWGL